MTDMQKSWVLHLGIIALLFVLQFILPAYHHGSLARIMVLTCYAMGYNILFGYTGLLSLGHALFFAAGMYGMSLSIQHLDWSAGPAVFAGLVAGFAMALVIGMLLLRTAGVAFMIVTLMFAQAGYLTVLYFGEWTRGDEGFVIKQELRRIAGFDLSDPTNRYFAALLLMAVCIVITLRVVQTGFGRVLVAIRENEDAAEALGINTLRRKCQAIMIMGAMGGAAGTFYSQKYLYLDPPIAYSVHLSVEMLLVTIVGGMGTVFGPLIGSLVLHTVNEVTRNFIDTPGLSLIVYGIILIIIISYLPNGLPIPVPENDGLDKPYWDATRRGELLVQRCKKCGTFQWGPEWICHKCLSFDLDWHKVSGKGRIYSWERPWHPVHPALKEHGPYVVVLVELPDAGNVRMLGNLLGDPKQEVRIGAEVQAVFEPHDDAKPPFTLVQWKLA